MSDLSVSIPNFHEDSDSSVPLSIAVSPAPAPTSAALTSSSAAHSLSPPADVALRPVMDELRQVYLPFPSFNENPPPVPPKVVNTRGSLIQTNKPRRAQGHSRSKSQAASLLSPASASGGVESSQIRVSLLERDDSSDEDELYEPSVRMDPQADIDAELALSWVKFIDPKTNTKLWFNSLTSQVQIGKPPPGVYDDEEIDEGQGNARRRRGSIDKSSAPADAKSVSASTGRDLLGDDYTVLNSMGSAKVVKSLQLMAGQIELIVNKGIGLSNELLEELKDIRGKFLRAKDELETSAQTSEPQNPIEALIEFDKMAWNFANPQVEYYRAASNQAPHDAWEYREWHVPQHYSAFPLPPAVRSVTALVHLPQADIGCSMHQIRVNFTDQDTVVQAIHNVLVRCKASVPVDESEFALKVLGMKDYLIGDRPVFDYEYVRNSIRDSNELKLKLIKRPQPIANPGDVESLADNYRKRVRPDVYVLGKEDYRALSARSDWQELKAAPISDVHLPFRVKILGLDNLSEETMPRLEGCSSVSLRVFLFHGVQRLNDTLRDTEHLPITSEPRWGADFVCRDTLYSTLPRAVRIGFTLIGRRDGVEVILGFVVRQLIDESGMLAQGPVALRMWNIPSKRKGKHKHRDIDPNFIYRTTNAQNYADRTVATLHVKFDQFVAPIVAPITDKYREPAIRFVGPEMPLKSLAPPQLKQLEALIETDSLYALSGEDRALLWLARHSLTKYPHMLPKFLQCVNWGIPDQKFEAHRLLRLWAPPFAPIDAIELLEAKFPDYTVREYAVNILRRLSDDELRVCLLQFTQILKYEPYHDSPLTRFLIERAIRSPLIIGHHFFWHLKAELHNPHTCERFAVILEEFLSFSGRLTGELLKQARAVQHLQRVAEMVVRLKKDFADEEVKKEYHRTLEKLNREFFAPMGKFQIPLNPKLEATSLIVEKCRYMSSKMVPLWLVFKNADPDAAPIYLIFKSGDDLRQDILTLQLLQVMDQLWLREGLDLRMKPYKCIATGINDHGEGVGMIEVVMDSDTTSGIQLKYGGGAMGALKMDPIDLFLKDNNKGKLYDAAVDNFVRSVAGYCVATFVLGIGDRHNGNIMVTKDGHLFHIDFGHFLGNFKKKFGVNRERAAFVFTPEMAYVMGGKNYEKSLHFSNFKLYSKRAFRALRVNANFLENLFLLMVSAGMPELMLESDIGYMRDKLALELKEQAADAKLESEIDNSLNSQFRRVDNLIHNWKHSGK